MVEENLSGRYRVRVFRPAFQQTRKLCPRTKDRIEIRRHALKLRYWPENHPTDERGTVIDLDWEWIRSLPGKGVGELRIGDVIGGNDNLRLIFFVGRSRDETEMPVIWILAAVQKKRQDWSSNEIAVFRSRRTLVIERFYEGRE